MSNTAKVDTTGLSSQFKDALVAPPEAIYEDRIADIVRALMRGHNSPLMVLVDLVNKKFVVGEGNTIGAAGTVKEVETLITADDDTFEVFSPASDQLESTTAIYESRFGSFVVTPTAHDFDAAAILVPAQPRMALSSLLEKVHNLEPGYILICQQDKDELLAADATLPGAYKTGSIYVCSEEVQSAVADKFDEWSDDEWTYTDGDVDSGTGTAVSKDTFGL